MPIILNLPGTHPPSYAHRRAGHHADERRKFLRCVQGGVNTHHHGCTQRMLGAALPSKPEFPSATTGSQQSDKPGCAVAIKQELPQFPQQKIFTMMKFGIILENSTIHQWQRQLIEETQKYPSRLELIINVCTTEQPRADTSSLIYRYWQKYHSKKITPAKADPLSLSKTREMGVITCTATSYGNPANSVDDVTVEAIKSHGLDFILCFSTSAPTGPILNAARLGVWSFNHNCRQPSHDPIAGFWDMYDLKPEIDVVLQRLTGNPDRNIVLQKSSIKNNKHSLRKNIKALQQASIPMVSGAIVDIQNGTVNPDGEQTQSNSASLPTNREMLRFFFRTSSYFVKNLLRTAFLNDHWQLAVSRTTTDKIMAEGLKNIFILKAGDINSFYYADPFVLNDSSDTLSILAEKYHCKSRRGSLVNVGAAIDANGIRETTTSPVLEMPTHLAYPSILRTQQKTYLIPDSRQYGRILIHAIDDTGNISTQSVIIDGRQLNDPTVVFHNSKYWLFASTLLGELYIWHTDNPEQGWMPHAKQPALISPSRTRGAGAIFSHHNQLIRPTQDCSEYYGKQIFLNRICVLDEHSFSQEPAGIIPPVVDGIAYDGLHTMNAGQHYVVVDLRTMHLDPLKPLKILYRSTKTKIGYKIRPGQPKYPAWLP